MKTISATAIVALMTVSVGFAAAAPAMAQDAPTRMHQQMQHPGDAPGRHMNNPRPGMNGPERGGMLGGLLDFGRDGENLEIALVRLAHRIDLTAEQTTLLETFKTAALAAQSDFADAVKAGRPEAPAAGATATARPDIVAGLNRRIAVEQAHVAALTAVQPSFEAFFTSLTDEQKTQLMPQRDQHMGWQGQNGKGPMGHHRNRPAMPGQADELNGPAATPPAADDDAAPAPAAING